jgi:CRP/FNR family transcriptional regulator
MLLTDKYPACHACHLYFLCHDLKIPQVKLKEVEFKSFDLKKGDVLYQKHQPFTYIYAVKAGAIKFSTERNIMKALYLCGDLAGLDGVETGYYQGQAEALDTTSVCAYRYEDLMKLSMGHDLKEYLVRLFGSVLNDHLRFKFQSKSAESRICLFLYELAERNRMMGFSPYQFNMNMPKSELAFYLDIKPETLSRILGKLKDESMIKVEHKNIEILNLNEIKKRSESLD